MKSMQNDDRIVVDIVSRQALVILIGEPRMANASQDSMEKALMDIVDTYWTVRVLREWDRARWTPSRPIGEREILALFILEQGGKQAFLERELGGVLGLPTSSASDMVKKLMHLGLIERREKGQTDAREKPLILTD